MRFLYLMDPLSRVMPDKDTTFAFIRASERRGHACFHAEPHHLVVRDGEPHAHVREVHIEKDTISLGAPSTLPLAELDAIVVRKDPPFDGPYLYATQVLELVRGRTLVVNDPRGLRDANEKLYALHFPSLMPRTLVTASASDVFAFAREVGGNAVVKPLDAAGGSGVMLLRTGDKNAKAIVELLSLEGKRLLMAQEYLPDVEKGDKRILLLHGEILGAILRVPQSDDLRSNIHVGGQVVPAVVTKSERELVATIAPRLLADGLIFVGLDVIGGKLTEVNVTSPTGIQELSRHEGRDMADPVVEWLEGASRSARGSGQG